ncbi:iron chelate uptake ABC transporter family permease subunit [Celeribacter sp.]|uniref:iron chelate uptake ABC transporter family permease subunit n=1 Tax=Celeribacter sp. TaxID=1890673 RepID=UPI003A8D4906
MHAKRLAILALVLALSCLAYMTVNARGNWGFVLPFRGLKLVALISVGVAVSTSTVVFQTVTRNRILTPSIMGFDNLFVLLLTAAVFLFGGQALVRLPAWMPFLTSLTLLIGASLALFGTLLASPRQDLMRLVLTGIIFSTLFRSLTSFMQRMIDPNEFSVVQVSSYARFTQVDMDLLWISVGLIIATHLVIWRMRHRLDVLGLGHEPSINLGISPKKTQFIALTCVAVLVSVATALVGPIAFLGLLVASIAYLVTPSVYHAVLLPSAALISASTLVAGQTVMERVFHLETPLTTVVDMIGGALFLFLLLKRGRS